MSGFHDRQQDAVMAWWRKLSIAATTALKSGIGIAAPGEVPGYERPDKGGEIVSPFVFYLPAEQILPVRCDEPYTVGDAAVWARAASVRGALTYLTQIGSATIVRLVQRVAARGPPGSHCDRLYDAMYNGRLGVLEDAQAIEALRECMDPDIMLVLTGVPLAAPPGLLVLDYVALLSAGDVAQAYLTANVLPLVDKAAYGALTAIVGPTPLPLAAPAPAPLSFAPTTTTRTAPTPLPLFPPLSGGTTTVRVAPRRIIAEEEEEAGLLRAPAAPSGATITLQEELKRSRETIRRQEEQLDKHVDEITRREKELLDLSTEKRALEARLRASETRAAAVPESEQVRELRTNLEEAARACGVVSEELAKAINLIKAEHLSKDQRDRLKGLVLPATARWAADPEQWQFPRLIQLSAEVELFDRHVEAELAKPGQTRALLTPDRAQRMSFVRDALTARHILEAVWESHIRPRYVDAKGSNELAMRERADVAMEYVRAFLCEDEFWLVESQDARLSRRRSRLAHILAAGDGKDTAEADRAVAEDSGEPLSVRINAVVRMSMQGRVERQFYHMLYRVQTALVIVFQCQQICSVAELKRDKAASAPRFDVLQWLVRRLPKQRVDRTSRLVNVLVKTCNPLEVLGRRGRLGIEMGTHSLLPAFDSASLNMRAYRDASVSTPLPVLQLLHETLELAVATENMEAAQRDTPVPGFVPITLGVRLFKLCVTYRQSVQSGRVLLPVFAAGLEAELLALPTRESRGLALLELYDKAPGDRSRFSLEQINRRYALFYRPAEQHSNEESRLTEAELNDMTRAQMAGSTIPELDRLRTRVAELETQLAAAQLASAPTTTPPSPAGPAIVIGSSSSSSETEEEEREEEEEEQREEDQSEADVLITVLGALSADAERRKVTAPSAVSPPSGGSPADSPERGGSLALVKGKRRLPLSFTESTTITRPSVPAPIDHGEVTALCLAIEGLQRAWDDGSHGNFLHVTSAEQVLDVAAVSARKAALKAALDTDTGHPTAEALRLAFTELWEDAVKADRLRFGKKDSGDARTNLKAVLSVARVPFLADMQAALLQPMPDSGLAEVIELVRVLVASSMPLSSTLLLARKVSADRWAQAALAQASAFYALILLTRLTPEQYARHREVLGEWTLSAVDTASQPPATRDMTITTLAGGLYLYLTAQSGLKVFSNRLRDAWSTFVRAEKPTKAMRDQPQRLLRNVLNNYLQNVGVTWELMYGLFEGKVGAYELNARHPVAASYLNSLFLTYVATTRAFFTTYRDALAAAIARVWSASATTQRTIQGIYSSTHDAFFVGAGASLVSATAPAPAPEPVPVPASAPMTPPAPLTMTEAAAPAPVPEPASGMQTAERQLQELKQQLNKGNNLHAVQTAKRIASNSRAAVRSEQLNPQLQQILENLPPATSGRAYADIRASLSPLLLPSSSSSSSDQKTPRPDPAADPFRW